MTSDANTMVEADQRRMARGKEIASHPGTIEKIGADEWSVPSQTGFGRYRVWFVEDVPRCTCPDFAARSSPCKHVYAILGLQASEARGCIATPERKPRKQYAQHQKYTEGQTGEMRLLDSLLHDLVAETSDLPKVEGKGGRPSIPLSDALYCAVLKVYSGLSGRRACGVYQNVFDRGLLVNVPSYNVASRALNRPETTTVLYRLLQLSASPLAGLEEGGAVAPDSTGMQTTQFGGWREEKHEEKRQRRWLKVHALIGTKTHVIIRAVVTESTANDSPQFVPLLKGALEDGFRPASIVADKGYLSRENYELPSDLGIEAFIPFKSNSVARNRSKTSPASWRKAFHLFQANREEFDRRYHQRSNVEAVFSALKRKFGENIRSRTPAAQVNEILCKLIAYNLTVVVHEMFENGISPQFAGRTTP
jgi:transposase